DADGLTDSRELELLTDPTSADTDGDLVPDATEVAGHDVTVTHADGATATRHATSDPTKVDTDADGLTDSRELALLTDPTSADTDADGLTDLAETGGWTVTATLPDGSTVTRDVLSDPL